MGSNAEGENPLKKKVGTTPPLDDNFDIPVWVDLPPSFYTRLNDLARELNKPRRDLLMDALALLRKQVQQKPLSVEKVLKDAATREGVREFHSKLSRAMWSKVSPEERAERARQMAEARWGKYRQEKEAGAKPSALKRRRPS